MKQLISRPHTFLLFTLLPLFLCCMETQPQSADYAQLDTQGHRGCRGLLPENTVPAFLKALDLGVKTLELDVVISADSLVVVSHEPFFNHEISLKPDGSEVSEEEERNHNLYQMTYEEIQGYDVGQRAHPRFPDQAKIAVAKPLLRQVISAAEAHANSTKRPLPWYNIETKSQPQTDNTFHPEPEPFVDLLMAVVQEAGITERTTIQSFDPRTLQVMKRKYPTVKLVFLVENEEGLQANLDRLGFVPEVYSPWFKYVDEELVAAVHEKKMELIPWTLNETVAFERALKLGVDGIITDYPDRLMNLLQ